jgi:hypothetical protein
MKKGDIIIIVVVLAVAAFLYFSGILSPGEKGSMAYVFINGEEAQKIDLSKDGEYTFETENGTNTLEIKNGKAKMISADCPDQICVNHAAVSKENESITCLPHKLIVEIHGGEKNNVDIVAQ